MDRTKYISILFVIGVLLLASLKATTLKTPESIFTAAIIFLYTIYLLYIVSGKYTYTIPKRGFILTFILISIVTLRILASGGPSVTILFFPVYTGVILLTNLFIIPQIVPRGMFFKAMSRYTLLLGLLAVPIWLLSPIEIAFIEFTKWNDRFLEISSIFANPNTFAQVSMIGFFGTLYEYNRRRTRIAGILLLLTGALVFIAHSRAVMGAVIIAGSVYLVQTRVSAPAATACVFGIFSGMFIVMSAIYLGWVPSVLNSVHLSGRLILWEGVSSALQGKQFWFGYGFLPPSETISPYLSEQWYGIGPHNTYYKWMLRSGVAATLLFILLFWGSILRSLRSSQTSPEVGGLGISWAIVLMFSTPLIIGSGILSILISLSLGYIITDSIREIEPQ